MKKGIVKLILPVVVTTGAVTGAVITSKVMSDKSFFNRISNQKTLNYVEKENSEEAIADVNTALTEAEKLVNDANEKVEAAKEEEKKVEAVKEEAEKEITDAEEEDEKASLNAKIKEAEEQAQQALKAKEEAEAKAKKAEEDAKIAEQKRKDAEAEQAKKAAEAERIRKEAEEAEKTRKEAEEAAKEATETKVESEPLTSSNKSANNTTTANNASESKKEEEQGSKFDLNNYPELLEQINEKTKKQEKEIKEEAAKKKVEFHFYSTNKNLTIHCREDFCGDSGHIWFVELECDSDKCEGFTDSNGKQVSTMLVGRRANITEITVTAPAAKPGYKFVGWELISSRRLVENGLGDKGYLTGKYIATYKKI